MVNYHGKVMTAWNLDCSFVDFVACSFREGTFFYWGGGGWAGASKGRVISKYFTNWGGSNLFDTQPGEGHSSFWQGKYNSMSVS